MIDMHDLMGLLFYKNKNFLLQFHSKSAIFIELFVYTEN